MNVLDLAKKVVQACCVLHAFVLEKDGYTSEDTLSICGFQETSVDRQAQRGSLHANDVRQKFAEDFSSAQGSVPWQINNI